MAFGSFTADSDLLNIFVSYGTLIMNDTFLYDFNIMNQLSSLQSLVLMQEGKCNITFFSAKNFMLSHGPLFNNSGVNFLLADSSFK